MLLNICIQGGFIGSEVVKTRTLIPICTLCVHQGQYGPDTRSEWDSNRPRAIQILMVESASGTPRDMDTDDISLYKPRATGHDHVIVQTAPRDR